MIGDESDSIEMTVATLAAQAALGIIRAIPLP